MNNFQINGGKHQNRTWIENKFGLSVINEGKQFFVEITHDLTRSENNYNT